MKSPQYVQNHKTCEHCSRRSIHITASNYYLFFLPLSSVYCYLEELSKQFSFPMPKDLFFFLINFKIFKIKKKKAYVVHLI